MKQFDFNAAFPSEHRDGLSKREFFVAMALQGILANHLSDRATLRDLNESVAAAITAADYLIERLNK